MRLKTIESVFKAFQELKVLVIGDVMLDSYVWGSAERISPEAPVPVIHVNKREIRLGGAGNVAVNCRALGATPILLSVTGKDKNGAILEGLMKELKLETAGILQSNKRKTTMKERLIAGVQQLLRVDDEGTENLNDKDNAGLLGRVKELLPSCHLVIFEDYDKGVLGKNNIQEITGLAKEKGIPVIVDPKKRNFSEYRNADLFKPNFRELKEGLNLEIEKGNIPALKETTRSLMKKLSLGSVMVTLSEYGIFYRGPAYSFLIKALKREIADVSGAGDTVVSLAGLCYALQLPPEFIAKLSNLAGGIVCEHPGVVPIRREDLLREAKINNLAFSL